MRIFTFIALVLMTALAVASTSAEASSVEAARKKCAAIVGPSYKGSKRWKLGVDKITCTAGALAARPVLPIAAKARARKSVKNGSFTCIVYPGGAECTGKGGQALGVASAAFGG